MAQWVSANLAALLPSEVDAIFTAIDSLLDVVSIPLQAVSSILNISKELLVSLPIDDWTDIVRGLINDFRNNLLGSGYYILDMWSYPLKQLEPGEHGPDVVYGNNVRLTGDKFSESFLRDLNASFDDQYDPNVPKFTSDVAMLVIVMAKATIDELFISTEEGNVGYAWRGFKESIEGAARALNELRWRVAWSKIRAAAEKQPSDKVAVRVERVQEAFRLFTYVQRKELDSIPIPLVSSSGESFFENTDENDLNWTEDIVPILESVEALYEKSSYPDWRRGTLRDVNPTLSEAVDYIFDAVLNLLEKGSTLKESIIALIDAIQAKLDRLQELIDRIQDLIDRIDDILNTTGFHALFVQSSNGITGLRQKLLAVENDPFTADGFFAGMAVLVGGIGVTAFNTIFSPIAE